MAENRTEGPDARSGASPQGATRRALITALAMGAAALSLWSQGVGAGTVMPI